MLNTGCLDKNMVKNNQFTPTWSPDISPQITLPQELNFLMDFSFDYLKWLPNLPTNFKHFWTLDYVTSNLPTPLPNQYSKFNIMETAVYSEKVAISLPPTNLWTPRTETPPVR